MPTILTAQRLDHTILVVPDLTIETSRLILRNYRTDDWHRVHIYAASPEFSQFELWGPNAAEDTQKFVNDMVLQATEQERYKFDLAVCLKETELLIGGCGIRREATASCVANLGWAINPDFQSQGLATEAAQALIDFGFSKLGLMLIYATCDARNFASAKVMEKLKMKQSGLIEGDILQKGHLRDTLRFELINAQIDPNP